MKKFVKIGRPGYRGKVHRIARLLMAAVTKQFDPETGQHSLLFQVQRVAFVWHSPCRLTTRKSAWMCSPAIASCLPMSRSVHPLMIIMSCITCVSLLLTCIACGGTGPKRAVCVVCRRTLWDHRLQGMNRFILNKCACIFQIALLSCLFLFMLIYLFVLPSLSLVLILV